MRSAQCVVALLIVISAGIAWTHLYSVVIPQRAGVMYLNHKYFESGNIYVNRFGRKSTYYFNMVGKLKYSLANNATVHLVFYEFLHNEYKRSFVEMHFKLCDMINKDQLVGLALTRAGIVCPIPKGNFSLTNITIQAEKFPNLWPFENNKVEITLQQTPSQDIMAQFYLILIIKQKVIKASS